MRSWVNHNLLRASAVAIAVLTGPAMLSGCGGAADTSDGHLVPDDPAEVEARNKTMEDYMKSAEGKKAVRGPR